MRVDIGKALKWKKLRLLMGWVGLDVKDQFLAPWSIQAAMVATSASGSSPPCGMRIDGSLGPTPGDKACC
jgi:hypothetical protein